MASQRAAWEHTGSKKGRVREPEDIMDEQPDNGNWFDIQPSLIDPL